MVDPELLALLVCPETLQDVTSASAEEVALINEAVAAGTMRTVGGVVATGPVDGALIRADRAVAYPIRDDIPVMLVPEGLLLAPLALATAAHV